MSVLFPGEELMIMDYNRVVKDLNGLSEAAFLEKVKSVFDVVEAEGKTATITVKTEDGNFTDTCVVTVEKIEPEPEPETVVVTG